MKHGLIILASFLIAQPSFSARPNILFIAIDDQNDWIGHLGGHPRSRTSCSRNRLPGK